MSDQRLLDVSSLPFDAKYECKDGTAIDMRQHLEGLRPVIEALASANYIKDKDSFGFAMMQPLTEPIVNEFPDDIWDKPEEFVWFVGGWGPYRDRYIANAVRKMRAMLREELPTLTLRISESPVRFQDIVDSVNDDGTFSWGDFPWGGATLYPIGDAEVVLMGSVSALSEIEDDVVAQLILGLLAQPIINGDGLLAD